VQEIEFMLAWFKELPIYQTIVLDLFGFIFSGTGKIVLTLRNLFWLKLILN